MHAFTRVSGFAAHTVRPVTAHKYTLVPVPRCRLAVAASAAGGREVVATDKAPGAVGPYSQAIKAGGLVFVSGQVALVPGAPVGSPLACPGDAAGQAERVMENLGAILTASGSGFDKVVKTTVLLADMGDFAAVNAVYGKYFPEGAGPRPARACFAVKGLPLGALVEIEAVAVV